MIFIPSSIEEEKRMKERKRENRHTYLILHIATEFS